MVISNQTYKLTEHTLMFSNKMFYLTDKRIEDMVLHESTNSQKDLQWDAIIDDRSLTYGVSAYCIVVSESSYRDALAAFKNSFWESFQNSQGVLHNAQVISLITTDIS